MELNDYMFQEEINIDCPKCGSDIAVNVHITGYQVGYKQHALQFETFDTCPECGEDFSKH